jgi:uncharacterized protein YjbJ (UPF0337 family)
MTDPDIQERAAGGLAGRIAGKAKEAAGSVLGNDELAREGRLQNAAAEAHREAAEAGEAAEQAQREADLTDRRAANDQERRELENELHAEQREEAAEQDRVKAELDARAEAERRATAAETERELHEGVADAEEARARADHAEDLGEAAKLEQQGRQAETRANLIDPEDRGS